MSLIYENYVVHNFQDGQLLKAEHVNAIEGAIASMQGQDGRFDTSITSLTNQMDVPTFSTSSTYIVGDLVIYEGVVYECIAKVSAAGAWNQENWEQKASAGSVENRIKRKIALMDSGDTAVANQYVTSVNVTDGKIAVTKGTVNVSTFNGQNSGLVPAPSSGDTNKFLKSDGTWDTVSSGSSCISTTVTLLSNGWSNNSQTVSNVSGVTASNNIIVSPDPTYKDAYLDASIVCTTQGSGTLTFVADTAPSTDVVVNVLIFG